MSRSEVHAYNYIYQELLQRKGWNENEVFTQQECQKIPAIAKHIKNKRPENIVQISNNTLYVIEAKNERNKIVQALREAEKDYSDKINKGKSVKAKFYSGVAGNDKEGFIVKSKYLKAESWETITENGFEVTGLLSKKQIELILSSDSPNLIDFEIDENEFLLAAENINQILHNGAINKDYRARVISALLLALVQSPNLELDDNPVLMVDSINSRVELMLKKHNKQEFARFIKIDLPSSEDNHVKFKEAVVLTVQELLELNIRSAMKSGKDVLGKFYEVFLKYGNGAKEIGIVLTPRHITRFSAKVLDINSDDLVYDPTCGTGGFLVAALDEVGRKEKNIKKFGLFKKYGIYGIEQQYPVVALALVNMIFRGDGKNNIIEGNCFNKYLNLSTKGGTLKAEYMDKNSEDRVLPITKVLMNPPFAQRGNNEKEYDFVQCALEQMQNDGLLFAIFPMSVFLKGGSLLTWRKEYLLKNHTLLSVLTFPDDLFYPVGVRTIGVFIKKGISHPSNQKVFWSKISYDGFIKSKGKRLISTKVKDEINEIKDNLFNFIHEGDEDFDVPKFYVTKPIDFNDKQLELIPEAYLNEGLNSIEYIVNEIDKISRELISYLITSKQLSNSFMKFVLKQKTISFNNKKVNYRIFGLTELFDDINTGNYHVSGDLDLGRIPLISCKTIENGTEGRFDLEAGIHDNCITIASDGSWPITSFYHPYKFASKDNVIICKPKREFKDLCSILFITAQLNSQIWRFSYGRKCYLNKVDKIQVPLPVDTKNNVDYKTISKIVKSCGIWSEFNNLK